MRALALTVVAALHVWLAIAVWRAKPASRVHRLFALQTLAIAGWALGNAGLQTTMWLESWRRVTFASASLIPPTFLVFAVHYPNSHVGEFARWQRAAMAMGVAFAVLSLSTSWIVHDVQLLPNGLFRHPGPLYPLFAIYFLVAFSGGLAVLARKWWRARDRERVQVNYFGLGVVVAAVGGITTNLIIPWLTGSSTRSHIGPYFGLAFIALTAHSIIRHRFLGLRVLVHRGLTFAIAALVSLLPVAALTIALRPRLIATFSLTELLLGGVALLAIGILIPPTRDMAGRVLDRYLYRSRVNPQRLLRESGAAISRCVDSTALRQVLCDAARRLVEPEATALYLRHDGMLVLDAMSVDGVAHITAPASVPRHTLAALTRDVDALLAAELDMTSQREVRGEFDACGWAVAIPLRADNEVLGVLAIGTRRSGDPFFADHVDTLVALGHAAGTALKTFELLRDRARAERLETLQRVTDGLAHEMGNHLSPIKTLARLLPDRHTDDRFVKDFARIVGRELERIERLLSRVRRVTPPPTASTHVLLDLREPLRHALEVVRALAEARAVQTQADFGAHPMTVRGDAAELEELFLNLLTNAIEAIAPMAATTDGHITLRASIMESEVVAVIEDSGPGIAPDVLDTIFDPFVSTKARGSGLGLSICAGIAARHRGRISAQNLSRGGAAFTVHFPLQSVAAEMSQREVSGDRPRRRLC